jgi:hypothetical protein
MNLRQLEADKCVLSGGSDRVIRRFFAYVPGYPPDAATTVTLYSGLIFTVTESSLLSTHA